MQLTTSTTRDLAIDRLRGLLVVLMVAGDFASQIYWVPDYLKHAPDIGFTIADVVAPLFVFVIGLNFGASFKRRESSEQHAYRYFGLRYSSLIGIGAIISAGGSVVDRATNWGVLQALGVAGLVTLGLIRLPSWLRATIALLILAGYQWVLDNGMTGTVLASSHGGFLGAFSWSALLLLSTVFADLWHKGKSYYLSATVVVSALAGFAAILIPVSKNRVSASYIIICLAISAITFLIFELVAKNPNAGLLSWWGQKALPLYLTHLVLLAIFVMPPVAWWYSEAPSWLSLTQLVVIWSLMSVFVVYLNSKTEN